LKKAVNVLLEKHIGAAPVLDKNGDLVGMLSAIDLLRALQDTIGLDIKKKDRKQA
jgi:CBS domain-containing protein